GAGANVTGLGPNTYTVTVTDLNGCQAIDATTVSEPLILSGSISSQTNVDCSGNATGSVTVAGAGGTTAYQYSINAGTTLQASGTFSGLTAGAYTILIEDNNGCQVNVPVNITEPAAVVAGFTYNGNQCFATQSFDFTDISTNATVWSWDFGASATPTTSSAQDPTGITFSAAGTYSVTLTASNAGCSDVFVTNVTVFTNPTVSASSTNISCNGLTDGTVTALASGTSGYSYLWNNGAGAGANVTGL